MDEVKLIVPSSIANVGLGFDTWSFGTLQPSLKVTYTKTTGDIEIEAKSPYQPPPGRVLGYAGRQALESFFRQVGIKDGAHILYEDDNYSVGGTGRSAADAVGAVISAAIIYEKKFTRDEIIALSAKGEPGEHKDNVAGSVNGRFNVVAISPSSKTASIDVYEVPDNLGVVVGYSSHKKVEGTEGMRRVTKYPVLAEDFIAQIGLISAATGALISGNVNRFLELVWGDRFHEPRRADIGGYGNFTANEFAELKKELFDQYGVALNISGAGKNVHFLYNKQQYKNGIVDAISPKTLPWFRERGIEILLKETEIAKKGAYDYAMEHYNL